MKNYDILFNNDSDQKTNDVIKNYFLEGDEEHISFLPNFSAINVIVGAKLIFEIGCRFKMLYNGSGNSICNWKK